VKVGYNLGMKTATRHKKPEIVMKDGKPTSVILDIEQYKELLERLEDADDLKMLEKMRSKKAFFQDS